MDKKADEKKWNDTRIADEKNSLQQTRILALKSEVYNSQLIGLVADKHLTKEEAYLTAQYKAEELIGSDKTQKKGSKQSNDEIKKGRT